MKKVNGIRIFFILTVLFVIGCYQILSLKKDNVQPEITETEQTAAETEQATQIPSVPVIQPIQYKYVIVEEEDYLTVYHADRETVYEYTDIRYSDLEDSLRQKIRKGYGMADEAALFGFLENYSS